MADPDHRATVIGGGVVGLASAIALAREGFAVHLVDAVPAGGAASWGNAGHIAIEQAEPLASRASLRSVPRRLFSRGGALAFPPGQWRHWLPFGLRLALASSPRRFEAGKGALAPLVAEAMPAWRRLAGTLPDPGLLREDGHFVVWTDPSSAARGRASWAAADIGSARFRDATPAEKARLANLGRTKGVDAIRFAGTGHIADLAELAQAMEAAFRDAGGRITRGHATVKPAGDAIALRIDGHAVKTPGLVVIAAGVRSRALLAPFGHRVPIVAERGYHIRATDHAWPADMPPVVFEDRSMIVTRYRDRVQAASFVEPGDPDAPPDPAKWARLERHVADLGLPMRPPFARWMGSRPTLPDYLPAMGVSRRARGLIYAFGHQHLGLTLAAATGEIVAALAARRPPPVPIGGFDIARFDPRR